MLSQPLNIFILHPSDLLTDCLPHGDGLLANLYIRKLAERGHQLHVAATKWQIEQPFPDNVHIHQISVPEPPSKLISRLLFAIKVRGKFAKLSKEIKFDVIHQLNPVVTGLSLGLLGTRIPMVMGPYVPEWPKVKGNKLQRPSFTRIAARQVKRNIWNQQHRMANGIILSSPAAMEKVGNFKSVAPKVHCIPYGIDSSIFEPSKLPDERTILFLAKVAEHKGILVLLEAFRKVRQEIPDATLIVAGNGPALAAAKQLAAEVAPADAIRFIGGVSRENVPKVIQQCRVFCLPSFGEAFGLSVLEAMSCGRPIVATNAGGLRHVVDDEGGRKVPVGDAKQLAAALIEILGNPSLAERMATYNREIVENKYAWPRVIDAIEDLYRGVVINGRDAEPTLACSITT